jgi:amino acid transporter
LRELVLYGIILIQSTAAMPLYGNISKEAHGHVATTILIGMVAMLYTAVSYGRMANAYPSAGSAYTYDGQELHPALGYLTGWAMLFDYVLNPIISVIWCSKAAMNFASEVPYAVWAMCFGVLFTVLNLRGIKASAHTNQWMAVGLGVVVVLFLVAAARHIWANSDATTVGFLQPWYYPETFSLASVPQGASLAMLTYIGFDAISTLSEEAHNPRRNILLATVLTCLITGILAGSQVYAAQLIWPSNEGFRDADTAFVEIAGRAGRLSSGRWPSLLAPHTS